MDHHMSKIVSLTLAQYRMLGRAVRGEKLSVANFRGPTASALARKGCWRHHGSHWAYTDLGKRVHAARGLLRPGHEVYDSATSRERMALGRLHTPFASETERKLAEQLMGRMREAGELRSS